MTTRWPPSVNAYVNTREIAGLFQIEADAKPGVELAKVEKAIDEELAKFLAEGPTAAELERVKTQYAARFVKGVETDRRLRRQVRHPGVEQVYGGSPDAYKKTLEHIDRGDARDAQGEREPLALRRRLRPRGHALSRLRRRQGRGATARRCRPSGAPPQVQFPAVQRATLPERPEDHAGRAALHPGHQLRAHRRRRLRLGQDRASSATSSLAMSMLDEGTAKRSSLQISEELAQLGAELRAGSDLDTCGVSLSTLKDKLDPALDIYADVILNPAFPEADFQRLQKLQIAQIGQEKDSPDRHGPPGPAQAHLRRRSPLRQPVHRIGHRGLRGQADPGRPRQVPQDLVQVRGTPP